TGEARVRHVAARLLVVGLADADDGARLVAHLASPSRMQTRFCCRHGPDVECASVRCLPRSRISVAASAMRTRPVAMIGLAGSGPPDGLAGPSGPGPGASTRIGSSCVNALWIPATSTGASSMPAALAASVVEGDDVRSRMPG